MTSTAKRTRYASDTEGLVCLLLDVRGQASPYSLRVWSYSKNKAVNLAYRYRDGRELTRNETPTAKRWCAVSVPRWLANKEGLYGKPQFPPRDNHDFSSNMYTPQQRRDIAERDIAEYVVGRENKYRRLPGQNWGFTKADARSARMFQ